MFVQITTVRDCATNIEEISDIWLQVRVSGLPSTRRGVLIALNIDIRR